MSSQPTPQLARSLTLMDAVAIGLGAVIGAGLFVVSGVAAGVAGPAILLSLLLAALGATFNGLSSAELAALYPRAGGTYEYGNALLSPEAGFAAGWLYLISKLSAGAVVALGFGSYLQGFFPFIPRQVSATLLLALLVWANLAGIKKAGLLNRVIVSITILALAIYVVTGSRSFDTDHLTPFFSQGLGSVFEAAAILFFAFTGYARIATLSEEVENPRTTIPKAIIITLVASALLYALVITVTLGAIGAEAMAQGDSPLFQAARVMTLPGILPTITLAALTAMVGVLLSQIMGTSRVFFAMARRQDMPAPMAQIDERTATPRLAIFVSAAVILAGIWIGNLSFITQTASFTILLYYGIANLSAMRLKEEDRFLPRWIPYAGLVTCLVMAFNLSPKVIGLGLVFLTLGFLFRFAIHRMS